MSLMKRSLLTLFAAPPGVLMLVLSTLAFPHEYYYPIYAAGGAALLAVGVTTAFVLLGRGWVAGARLRVGLAVFAAVLAGWLAAVLVMGLLNLTPLCVGANNGDGNNDLSMCVVYTGLWAVVYGVPVTAGGLACGLIAGLFSKQ